MVVVDAASRREGLPESAEEAAVAEAKRDPKQFAVLYETNFGVIYGFVARRVRSREDAEDVTAAVFLKALAKLQQFEWRGVRFVAWLMRIARNELTDRSRDRTVPFAEVPVQSEDVDLDEIDRRAALLRRVAALPEDQLRVLVLRLVEEWTVKEVAMEMGRTEGAVKQLQFRALTTLRAQLGGDHD